MQLRRNIPMETDFRLCGVNCVHQNDLNLLQAMLQRHNFDIHILHGETVTDLASFYLQAEKDGLLPAGRNDSNRYVPPEDMPDYLHGPKMNAFADDITQLLAQRGKPRVAILWTYVDQIATRNLQDLLNIVTLINRLEDKFATRLSDYRQESGSFYWELFLLGEGPSFQSNLTSETNLFLPWD